MKPEGALGLLKELKQEGYALTCCSYAKSDLVMELQEEDEASSWFSVLNICIDHAAVASSVSACRIDLLTSSPRYHSCGAVAPTWKAYQCTGAFCRGKCLAVGKLSADC